MFESTSARPSTLGLIFNLAEVTYHTTARKVRKGHGNAFLSIAISVLQSVLFLAAFYFMFSFLGVRASAIRGNYIVYLMSGIFLYLTHIQTVRSVMTAEGPTSDMMQHAPMNTLVSILSAALSTLYVQTLSALCILLMIHTALEPVHIDNWSGALMMFLLSWGSGVSVGLIFMAAKPWMPDLINVIQLVYIRANMIASGKMFVANMLPSMMVGLFDWNPLFHTIDQTRGFIFVNYFPHVTNTMYPLYLTLALLVIGMMAEAYTRKHVSASWGAKR